MSGLAGVIQSSGDFLVRIPSRPVQAAVVRQHHERQYLMFMVCDEWLRVDSVHCAWQPGRELALAVNMSSCRAVSRMRSPSPFHLHLSCCMSLQTFCLKPKINSFF